MRFDQPDIMSRLEKETEQQLDAAPFGIVGLDPDMRVKVYNRTESAFSGFSREFVLGRHFFEDVGPCMNNYMVALKLERGETLDETLDYVLTYRMEPAPVSLRLLKRKGFPLSYVLIRKK